MLFGSFEWRPEGTRAFSDKIALGGPPDFIKPIILSGGKGSALICGAQGFNDRADGIAVPDDPKPR